MSQHVEASPLTYGQLKSSHVGDELELMAGGHGHLNTLNQLASVDEAEPSTSKRRKGGLDKQRDDLLKQQNEMIANLTRALNDAKAPVPKSNIANPAALGLAGFASTTFILSAYNTTLLDPITLKMVLPMALWFGGTGQLLAGILEFLVNNMFGGTAFVAYGCFWLSYATLVEFIAPEILAAGASTFHYNEMLAFYLMMWLVFSIYMMIGSFRTNGVLVLIFITLVPTLICLVAGHYALNANTLKAGGYFGLICASFAFYGSAANVINGSYKRTILPTFPYPFDLSNPWDEKKTTSASSASSAAH